jgi:folate-binding protein YgfZ
LKTIADQYRIIEETAGWILSSRRGFLRFEGREAVPFLQALVTNDVARLTRGEGVYAAYLTPQGRMIADLEIFHRGEVLLAAVASGLASSLATRLDTVIFAEDVQVADVSHEYSELFVAGAAAARLISRALDVDQAALDALPELCQADAGPVFVVRSGEAPVAAFRIVASATIGAEIARRLDAEGVQPMTDALVESMRVAAARPTFGRDMTSETIPLEAGLLDRAISTTKGCYVGQEIVIRILHRGRGRVAKQLVRLAWTPPPAAARPSPGTTLAREGKSVGHLTSIASALTDDGLIGLGYVARDAAAVGQTVTVGEGGHQVARITGLAT